MRRDVPVRGRRQCVPVDTHLRVRGKLVPKWVGPYLVTEVRKSGVSTRRLGKTNPVFHVSQLKPYVVSELEWPGRQQHHRTTPELVV